MEAFQLNKDIVPPRLELAFEAQVEVGSVLPIGASASVTRRTVPILGGTVCGPRVCGIIRTGGADWQFVRPDGLIDLDAQYLIETDDGVLIEVRNKGIRFGPPEVLARLAAGEAVAPDEYYFRTAPRFFAPDGRYEWLRESIFVATGERYADRVTIQVWRVL